MTDEEQKETMTIEEFRESPEGQKPIEEEEESSQQEDESSAEMEESAIDESSQGEDEGSGSEESIEPSKNSELQGLTAEEQKLREDIEERRRRVVELRKERRLLKQQEESTEKESVDSLEDVDPNSIEVVKRVARASGFLTKEEWEKQQFDTINAQHFESFLDSHPEYREENDIDGSKWNTYKRYLALYARPENPHDMAKIYAKAQKDLEADRTPTSKPNPAKAKADQQKLKLARQGSGGSQATKPKVVTYNRAKYDYYIRTGWTEEEAKDMSRES